MLVAVRVAVLVEARTGLILTGGGATFSTLTVASVSFAEVALSSCDVCASVLLFFFDPLPFVAVIRVFGLDAVLAVEALVEALVARDRLAGGDASAGATISGSTTSSLTLTEGGVGADVVSTATFEALVARDCFAGGDASAGATISGSTTSSLALTEGGVGADVVSTAAFTGDRISSLTFLRGGVAVGGLIRAALLMASLWNSDIHD